MTPPDPYYSDDHVTIYHGDCLELLPEIDADVLVTDPPYGIAWKRGANAARSSKSHDGIQNDRDTAHRDAVLHLFDGPAVVFASPDAPLSNFRHLCVWQKADDAGVVGSTVGFRRDIEFVYLLGEWPKSTETASSVLRSWTRGNRALKTEHPHEKPVDVMATLIGKCPPGVILDPFMGSGTTLRAAKDLGRKAIGIEIEERYCEIAALRLGQEVLDFGGVA